VCTSVAGETAAFAIAFRSSRAAIPELIGISQMRRLKDKVFRKKVGVSPNDNDLTRSQHYPVSDYMPADVAEGKFGT
jgi:hypothetical protein